MSWFDSYEDEYQELLDYLINDYRWMMKRRYAVAFLNAYRRKIGKRLRRGRIQASNIESPLLALELEDLKYPVVTTAYEAYMIHLRRGKHVGTDVEKVIWAILDNCSGVLEEVDKGFHDYIVENAEKKFPDLYGEVLSLDDPEDL